MVKQLLSLAALVLLVVALFNNPAFATDTKGDTLVIHQADQDAMPWNEIVAADTNSDGTHAHSVYELDPDGWYPLSGELVFDKDDMTIIGGKRTAGQMRPVILVQDPFGGWFMLGGAKNITIEGIHMMQCAETIGGNVSAWARSGLELRDVNSHVVIHDCIWDFNTGFACLLNKDGLNLKVTNCLFRFNKPLDNGVWAGQGIDISSADLDSILIQNCTWYGGGPFMLKTWESTETFFKMDHCDLVDFVQWPIHGSHWVNSQFTNNLFYNAYTMGEDTAQIKGQDLDHLPFGVINIDTIFFVDTLGHMNATQEAARKLLVSHNNNFVKQNIMDYWAVAESDPTKYHGFVAPDPAVNDGFMNSRTAAMFADDATWPGLVLESTTSLDPQFQNYLDYSDTLINYSKFYYKYAWPDAKATSFMLDPDGEPLQPTDPMVYNLKITNAALRTASTSGGPIGDLTWELANGYNSTNDEIVTDVKGNHTVNPVEFSLYQNYPNPFNPTTNIAYTVTKSGFTTLKVYNVLGQEVKTLFAGYQTAGTHSIEFNAANLASGVYLYRLESGNNTLVKKMVLMK